MIRKDIFAYSVGKLDGLDDTWQRNGEWGNCDPVKFSARSLYMGTGESDLFKFFSSS